MGIRFGDEKRWEYRMDKKGKWFISCSTGDCVPIEKQDVERNGSLSACKKQILRMRFKIDKSFVQPPLSPPHHPPSQPKEHNCIIEFRRALTIT
jgi:hypothetical protein